MVRVAVAMSGGVDSSVVAYLLKTQGYDVVGITAKMVHSDAANHVVQNAKSVANYLGLEHYVVDLTDDFQSYVINYFKQAYRNGETPNPCIMCNKFIKWGKLLDYAISSLGVDYVATGHYANIKKIGEYYKLYPAKDEKKDQLYFLFGLNQKQLSKTLFPLSIYDKSQIKELAKQNNLPLNSAKESQDICFINKPMTTKKYLLENFESEKGDFIDIVSGEKLGEHEGYFQYTIGQRKGIGIAASTPLYVVDINAKENKVYLGTKENTLKTELIIDNFTMSYPFSENLSSALVKIRYNMKAVEADLEFLGNDKLKINFKNPISGIAKGQACVLYDINDGHLLGGNFI